MIFHQATLLLSVALLVAPFSDVSAFVPVAPVTQSQQLLLKSSPGEGNYPEPNDGAGMKSFGLVPDQGKGTTMNPRYQIDSHSIYPPAMMQRRSFSASSSSSVPYRGGPGGRSEPFHSSPDFHMWDGTTGMSRRPIDPESSYPMGMMSFSRQSAAAPSSENKRSLLPSSSSTSPSSSTSSSSLAKMNPEEMTKEEQWEYAAALRSRAGRNHMMWDGTTGMSRVPINPSSSYPRGMRRGMW